MEWYQICVLEMFCILNEELCVTDKYNSIFVKDKSMWLCLYVFIILVLYAKEKV